MGQQCRWMKRDEIMCGKASPPNPLLGLALAAVLSSCLANRLHIDLAFPLDGGDDIDNFQLLFEGKTSF